MAVKRIPTELQLTHKFYLSTGLAAATHKTVYLRWRSSYLKKLREQKDAQTK